MNKKVREITKKLLDPSLDDKLRKIHPDARKAFHELPIEKKQRSLDAKTFIIYPFEVNFNQAKSLEEKEQDSIDLIKEHLKEFDHVFVSTSHGFDSVVLCHLIMRAWRELQSEGIIKSKPDFWLNNTLNIYKEERAYWNQINKFLDIEDTFTEFKPPFDSKGNRYTVWSVAEEVGHLPSFRVLHGRGQAWKKRFGDKVVAHVGSKGDIPECCDILKKASIKEHLKQGMKNYLNDPTSKKYDCHFVGTRAEESRQRRISVMQRCRSYTIKTRWPYPIRACTPLSYWLMKDTMAYYEKYKIPKNPTYQIHNMLRMGCASCPAHKNWEIRLARDPTHEGFGMLNKNLEILGKTEPERLEKSLKTLKKYLKSTKSENELNESTRVRVIDMIKKFENSKVITETLNSPIFIIDMEKKIDVTNLQKEEKVK